jgi:hypothetical protein
MLFVAIQPEMLAATAIAGNVLGIADNPSTLTATQFAAHAAHYHAMGV